MRRLAWIMHFGAAISCCVGTAHAQNDRATWPPTLLVGVTRAEPGIANYDDFTEGFVAGVFGRVVTGGLVLQPEVNISSKRATVAISGPGGTGHSNGSFGYLQVAAPAWVPLVRLGAGVMPLSAPVMPSN